MDAEIKQEFNRLHAKLNNLMAAQKKETWIKVGFLTELTGWNNEKLRQAREQGIVKRKKTPEGWFYLLESVPEQFIKKAS